MTDKTDKSRQTRKKTMKYMIPREKFLEDSIVLVEIEFIFELKKKRFIMFFNLLYETTVFNHVKLALF